MGKLFNRVRMTVSGTPGTGTITLLAAYSNAYCTFAEAGVATGNVVSYFIEDGTDFEIGIGTYTSAGTTLSRDTVRLSKIGGTSGTTKLTLTSAAVVYISPGKEDLGPVLQCLQTTYATNTALSTLIPYDDTVPTSTEGTQILSQAITPQVSGNKILCFVEVWGSTDGDSVAVLVEVALFRGTTCINVAAAASNDLTTMLSQEVNVNLVYLDSPASASAQTYSVRVGANSSGDNVYLNGVFGGRKFGGASVCTLTVLEIAV